MEGRRCTSWHSYFRASKELSTPSFKHPDSTIFTLCRQHDVGRKVTLHSSYGRQLNITPGVKTWYLLVMIKIVTRTGNGTAQIRFHDNDLMNVKSIGNGTNVTHSITTFKRSPPSPSHMPYLWSKHKGNQKADCDTGEQNRLHLSVCMYVLAHTCLSSFDCWCTRECLTADSLPLTWIKQVRHWGNKET